MIFRLVFFSVFIFSCASVEEKFSFKEEVVTDTKWKLKAYASNVKDCKATEKSKREQSGSRKDDNFFKPLKEASEPVGIAYDRTCIEELLMDKIKTIAEEELCKNGNVERVFLCKSFDLELSSKYGLECYIECEL